MTPEMPSRTDLVLLFSVLFALVPIGVCYLARWVLDRGRTEPPWMFPVLMLAGGAGGMLFALYGGEQVAQGFGLLYGMEMLDDPLVSSSLLLPAAEELGKAFILLPFALTAWYRGPVDGLLYGLAAGAGFACAESFMYFANAWEFGGGAGWMTEIVTRAGPSVVIHGGATAAVGAFIGAARFDRRPAVAVGALFCGGVLALAIHGGWNLLLTLSRDTDSMLYAQLAFLMLPVTAIGLIGAMAAALKVEASGVSEALDAEVKAGRIDQQVVDAVFDRKQRKAAWAISLPDVRGTLGAVFDLGHSLRRAALTGRASSRALRRVDRLRRALDRA